VVELADDGFPLAGGRLDYIGERVVAALVYRRNRHVINLFVWPSKPGASLSPTIARHSGYSVIHWRDGGLEYWAVSDVDPHDLEAFHQAFAKRTQS
jgi:anti-sigma factor RsiW